MGKENAINNISAGSVRRRIISVPDKFESVYIYTNEKLVIINWFFSLSPNLNVKPDVFGFWTFHVLAGKSGSPAKKKKQCHETVSSDDSEAEMSIFKQPGKKRKPNNNKTLVSRYWFISVTGESQSLFFM